MNRTDVADGENRAGSLEGSRRYAPDGSGAGLDSADPWSRMWPTLHGELVRYASHLLAGDTYAAEDVAQETAVRLWLHPEVLRDDRPVGGWARTVAHNIVVDRVRRRRARPAETALESGIDVESADDFDDLESTDSVTTMLAELSPKHRDVVFEVYVRDRAIADIAAELRIPTGTVKSRCHHALRQLRRRCATTSTAA